MWKLIPKPLRRWILFAIAIPVVAWMLEEAAEAIAQRRGESRATRIMREPRRWVHRYNAA
jgi:hypothetical protein